MPISAARRIRMLLALVLVVLGGALALPAAAQDDGTARAERHRRRAGRRAARPAERRARGERGASRREERLDRARHPTRGHRRGRRRTWTSSSTSWRTRRSRSACGSDRPGADARGASALLALSAPIVSVAPGAGIGPAYPLQFDEPGNPPRAEVVREVRAAQAANDRSTDSVDAVVDRRLSSGTASRLDVVNSVQPTVGDFIVSLDGQTVTVDGQAGEARHRRRDRRGQRTGAANRTKRSASTSSISVSNSRTPWTRRGSRTSCSSPASR